jgi:hypothetical protein
MLEGKIRKGPFFYGSIFQNDSVNSFTFSLFLLKLHAIEVIELIEFIINMEADCSR